jgi:hypothetical protein
VWPIGSELNVTENKRLTRLEEKVVGGPKEKNLQKSLLIRNSFGKTLQVSEVLAQCRPG